MSELSTNEPLPAQWSDKPDAGSWKCPVCSNRVAWIDPPRWMREEAVLRLPENYFKTDGIYRFMKRRRVWRTTEEKKKIHAFYIQAHKGCLDPSLEKEIEKMCNLTERMEQSKPGTYLSDYPDFSSTQTVKADQLPVSICCGRCKRYVKISSKRGLE